MSIPRPRVTRSKGRRTARQFIQRVHAPWPSKPSRWPITVREDLGAYLTRSECWHIVSGGTKTYGFHLCLSRQDRCADVRWRVTFSRPPKDDVGLGTNQARIQQTFRGCSRVPGCGAFPWAFTACLITPANGRGYDWWPLLVEGIKLFKI